MGALEAFRALPPSCGSIRMPMKPLISIPPFSKTPAASKSIPPEDSTVPKGSILTIAFELDGQKLTASNGGPIFKFTEAISFVVRCNSQQEITIGPGSRPTERRAVRLDERQIWLVLADRPGENLGVAQASKGQGSDAEDEKAEHR